MLILSTVLISCSKKTGVKAVSDASEFSNAAEAIKDISKFQNKLNEDYKNRETSPLSASQLEEFKLGDGHDFFDADLNYRVEAKFEKMEEGKKIKFATTTDRSAIYNLYGVATFTLDGKECSLNIYQSDMSLKMEEYKDYLFLPFNDLTNSVESYGGGRYVDLMIQDIDGSKITIDFNKAYNPYCAYSSEYSCPIPPKENNLPVEIRAGVKLK